MPSDDPSDEELEDARLLYAFGKTQAFNGDNGLAAMAVVIAGDLAGQEFGRISESCGWARRELFGLEHREAALHTSCTRLGLDPLSTHLATWHRGARAGVFGEFKKWSGD
jgi:hypothetical protein